jgi:hypothetical protein
VSFESAGQPLHAYDRFNLLEIWVSGDYRGMELPGKGSDKAIHVTYAGRCFQSRSGEREGAVNVNYLDRRRFNGAKCFDGGIKTSPVLEAVNHLAEVDNRDVQRAALLLSLSNESLQPGSAGLVLEKRH